MTIDLRARCTCTLGELISASVSDSSIVGAGLIKTTGSCEINGLVNPGIGTVVRFYYEKFGVTRELPRQLKVLSSFANPFTGVTTVDLGCQLTYMDGVKEPKKVDAFDDPGNSEFTGADAGVVVIPTSASAVAQKCLTEIGLTGTVPLTNVFSVAEFDLGAGYVSVLNDLLISECLCGYVDKNGNFVTFSLLAPLSSPLLIQQSRIVDVGPLGATDIPGNPVIVNYSTLKLKSGTVTGGSSMSGGGIPSRDWEEEVIYGAGTEVVLNGSSPTSGDWEQSYFYTPKTETRSKFDTWDRLKTRTTVTTKIAADSNSAYSIAMGNRGSRSIGSARVETKTVTTIKYKIDTPAMTQDDEDKQAPPVPEEGYDEVLSETTITYEPEMVLYGSLPIDYEDFVASDSFNPSTTNIAEITTVSTVTVPRDVGYGRNGDKIELGFFPVTKTTTVNQQCLAKTPQGQKAYKQAIESGSSISAGGLISSLNRVVETGVELRIFSGREAVFQGRPSKAERNISDRSAKGDGSRTESSSRVEFVYGTETVGYDRPLELTMPYAPDHIYMKTGSGPTATFTSVGSDAPQKAANFGRTQNKLLFGACYGIEIQASPEDLPARPYTGIAIQAKGITGGYATDASSWVIDSSGILASTSAIFVGVIGQASGGGSSPTVWLPALPGVTYPGLPPTPGTTNTSVNAIIGNVADVGVDPQATLNAAFPTAASGNGVIDNLSGDIWSYNGTTWTNVGPNPGILITTTGTLPFWNELVRLEARTKTGVNVRSLPYPLNRSTALSIATRTGMTAFGGYVVPASVANLTLSALAPRVYLVSVTTYPIGLTVSAPPATAKGAEYIEVPAASLLLEVIQPAVSP
jgi:hypothetical protein